MKLMGELHFNFQQRTSADMHQMTPINCKTRNTTHQGGRQQIPGIQIQKYWMVSLHFNLYIT